MMMHSFLGDNLFDEDWAETSLNREARSPLKADDIFHKNQNFDEGDRRINRCGPWQA